MRTITTHHTNESNRAITITADDRDPNNGNASHHYEADCAKVCHIFDFQRGPIAEVGVNGITNEVLLAIVIDRLEGFQSSKFANPYNQSALDSIVMALHALEARTKEREARGVEGTHEV